jgi:hypothetical protein
LKYSPAEGPSKNDEETRGRFDFKHPNVTLHGSQLKVRADPRGHENAEISDVSSSASRPSLRMPNSTALTEVQRFWIQGGQLDCGLHSCHRHATAITSAIPIRCGRIKTAPRNEVECKDESAPLRQRRDTSNHKNRLVILPLGQLT